MNTPRIHPLAAPLLALACAAAAVVADAPTAEQYRANWPRFRGPDGGGVFSGDVPLSFDVKSGANIAWKAEVPDEGHSSPVIWGDRVFLSGGDEEKREVMCFDAQSGKLLWKSAVPADENTEKAKVPDECGMAASTMAADGQRVFAMFTNGDLAAFTLDGTPVWTKHLGAPKNQYGHAASLLTWGGRVIVQLDQGEPDDKLSKLIAFDGATGAPAWEKPREVGASWSTPVAFEAAGKAQLITLAVPWVISYSPADGSELWRAECLDGEVTPSPVLAGGALLVVSPANKLQSIRPDGSGDVSKSHLGWIAEDGIPDVTSPVSNGELVFLLTSGGVLTCYDAKTGKKQWEQDFAEDCSASPSIAAGRVYFITRKGVLIAVEAAREFKDLARSPLGENVFASPGFARGRIFIRGVKHLFCIGSEP